MLIKILKKVLKPYGKANFLTSLPKNSRVLDVGCGNNSPHNAKKLRNDIFYVGIDIEDYNQSTKSLDVADEYIIANSNTFSRDIDAIQYDFDAIISSHNLEHCDNREAVLRSMSKKLLAGGKFYLAFPSSQSVKFPKRTNTLNYFDDTTHVDLPPNVPWVLSVLKEFNLHVDVFSDGYRPLILRLLGMLIEPISILTGKRYLGSWEYHGFETIIIASKRI